jgi:cytidylate kinase
MSLKPPVITIDGASGTGKGVICHLIAKELDWHLLDSGVLYRVLAYAAIKHDISLEDEAGLVKIAENLDLKFNYANVSAPPVILYEKEDVTDAIRNEAIGNGASKVGSLPEVRKALLQRQYDFRQPPGLVTDGRDMGTVIFPDAFVKIFLTASPEERAKRRAKQLKEKGIEVNLEALIEELRERDKRDQERAVAPLKPAVDAICIDTDKMTIEEVFAKAMSIIRLQN